MIAATLLLFRYQASRSIEDMCDERPFPPQWGPQSETPAAR